MERHKVSYRTFSVHVQMAKALFAWVLYNVITQQSSVMIFNTSNITDINQSLDLPIVLLNICPNYPLCEWGVSKITQDSAHTGPKRVFTKFFDLYTNATTVSVKPCSTTLLKIANLAKLSILSSLIRFSQ